MTPNRATFAVEIREGDSGPILSGTILQEGRAAAGGRAELFAPHAVSWPADGVRILTEHRGPAATRAIPTRNDIGEIRISTPAPPAVVAAVSGGKRYLSVEFYPTDEQTTAGGVREIRRAFVDAASLTDRPEYAQARAEVRSRRRRLWL